MDKKTLELYRSMVPHGRMKRIAEKAGVSRMAVCSFFRGESNSFRVEKAALEVIAEVKKEREEKLIQAGLL